MTQNAFFLPSFKIEGKERKERKETQFLLFTFAIAAFACISRVFSFSSSARFSSAIFQIEFHFLSNVCSNPRPTSTANSFTSERSSSSSSPSSWWQCRLRQLAHHRHHRNQIRLHSSPFRLHWRWRFRHHRRRWLFGSWP